MENKEGQLISNIEIILNSIRGCLEALSEEEQKRILEKEQIAFTETTGSIITHDAISSQLHGVEPSAEGPSVVGFILNSTHNLVKRFISSRSMLMHYENCARDAARLADSAHSDPHLYNAMIKAGEIFEQTNSPHLNEKSHQFREEIASADKMDSLAKSIITTCRTLSAVHNGQVLRLLLNINDIKIMLKDTFNRVFNSSSITESFRETHSRPIISENQFAWVKYEFSSNISNESGWLFDKKICDFNIKMKYYCFPDEDAFRAALKEAETEVKKKSTDS